MTTKKTDVKPQDKTPKQTSKRPKGAQTIIQENMRRYAHEIIRTNKTKKQIAEELGLTSQTLINYEKRKGWPDIYNDELLQYRREAFAMLGGAVPEAINKLIEQLQSETEWVVNSAYTQILDRLGFNAKEFNRLIGDPETLQKRLDLEIKEKELKIKLLEQALEGPDDDGIYDASTLIRQMLDVAGDIDYDQKDD